MGKKGAGRRRRSRRERRFSTHYLRLRDYVDLRGWIDAGAEPADEPVRGRRRARPRPVSVRGSTQLDFTWAALRRLVRDAAPFNPPTIGALAHAGQPARDRLAPIEAREPREDPRSLGTRLIEHLSSFYRPIDEALRARELLWDTLVVGADIDVELVALDRIELRGGRGEDTRDLAAALLLFRPFWVRSPRTWPGGDPSRLLEHLLVAYPLPRFLLNAWRVDARAIVARWLPWIITLGQGGSLRRLSRLARARGCPGDWPVLGKKLPAMLAQVPDELSPKLGVMYAEVLRLGGTAIEYRRLRSDASYSIDPLVAAPVQRAFWAGAVRWLTHHRDRLDRPACAMILAWARHQHIERRRTNAEPFTWPGRSPQAALREARAYELELRQRRYITMHRRFHWTPHGLNWHADIEGTRWTIRELISSQALAREGLVMRHCVLTYEGPCVHGRCAIVSLRRDDEPRLTVELRLPSARVVQVRGAGNRSADEREEQVLARWQREVLGVSLEAAHAQLRSARTD